jgi:prepilin-type N-terminal cleavage/methylation domain-containing protein/prepilin-type processing-associated H-X9-DG protein
MVHGSNKTYDKRGFTLVELLVVIAIIVALIAILLPALNHANETAKGLQCLSNLREMGQAATDYVADNNGYYPSAQYTINTPSTSTQFCWDLTVITSGGVRTVVPGLLWHSGDPMTIQQCPSFYGSSAYIDNPYTGYNYNTSYIGHGQGETVATPAKAVQIPHSDQVAIFGDGQFGTSADKFMRAPYANPGDAGFPDADRYAGTQGYRHLGRTNVCYCDGHAEAQRAVYTGNPTYAGMVAPGTGFLTIDNRAYGAQ